MRQLLGKYVESLPNTIASIREHLNSQRWEDLKVTIHTLKGTGAAFGYPELTDIAGKIEFQILKKDSQTITSLVDMLENLVQRITLGLQE